MKNLSEYSQSVIQLPDSPEKVVALLDLAQTAVYIDEKIATELVRGAEVIASQFDDIHLHRLCARTLAFVYTHQHLYGQALELLTDVISSYNQESDWEHLSECFQEISEFYYFIGDIAKAADYLSWAISVWKGIKSPKNLTPHKTLLNIAKIYVAIGETERAINLLQECVLFFSEKKEHPNLAIAYFYLGIIHKIKKNYLESSQFLGKSIELYDQLGFVSERLNALAELGVVLSSSGQFQEAHTYFLAALETANHTSNKYFAAKLFLYIGNNHLLNNNLDEAQEYFENAWLIIEQLSDSFLSIKCLHLLSLINLKKKNSDAAASYLVSAQNIIEHLIEKYPNLEAKIAIQPLWSEVYTQKEDYFQALKSYQEYHLFEQQFAEYKSEIKLQNHQALLELRKINIPEISLIKNADNLDDGLNAVIAALNTGDCRKQEDLFKLLSGFAHDVNGTLSTLKTGASNIETAVTEITAQIKVITELFPKHIGSQLETIWHNSLNNPTELSNKETRQNNKALTVYLESAGIQDGQWFAEKLTRLGINRTQLDDLIPLLKDNYGRSLIQFAHSVVSLKSNSGFIKSSLLKTEKTTHSISALVKQLRVNSFQKEINIADSIEFSLSLLVNRLTPSTKIIKNIHEAKTETLRCSPDSLNQVWFQLLQNAIAAIGTAGEVTITATRTVGHWQISFANNGQEIPPDIRSRIFEPFFTTKNKSENTGLGLYLVRRIVEEDLKGAIFVHSSPILTTFTVHLPASS
ncbi:MAG: tetratricopeptide repeat protein [Bacteroidia bacterium]|nr:tetratricopeptide repeat protein [Bacteroidia bacterium]